jgi:hypothetical protein
MTAWSGHAAHLFLGSQQTPHCRVDREEKRDDATQGIAGSIRRIWDCFAEAVIVRAFVRPVGPQRRSQTKRCKFQMPKALAEIRSLARSHTRTALNVLVGIMRSNDATAAARVSAANAILDRGWGKAPQAIQNGDEGAIELIHRIERVIVHPENPDS